MWIQSNSIRLLLFVALSAGVEGSLLTSTTHVRAATAATVLNRIQDETRVRDERSNQEKVPPETAPLTAAVMNTKLKALDGSTFRLADYQGKVILVNLWATWCPPCRAEIPNLVKVSQEFKAKGVEVVGLTNEDPETETEMVQNFVHDFNITYQVGWGDQDFVLALMQEQVKNNIPQTFVISRDGRVLTRFVGFNGAETPRKLRRAIEDALNEK